MDPEIDNNLREQLATMTEILSQQNSVMSTQIKNLNDLVSAQKNQSSVISNATSSTQNSNSATTGNTKKIEALSQANSLVEKSNSQLARSFISGRDSLLTFASAMLDTTPGLTKYAKGVEGVTDAVGSAAANFGILGKASSKLLSIFSSLTESSFKYSDAIVKGFDDIAKAGGAIGTSAEQILSMGHAAGLSSQNLEIFTKHAIGLGENIRSLGNTTSDGIASFGKIAAVGDKTLMQYRKLGFSQDELMEAQAKYIDLQAKAGGNLNKSPKELQKASLAYIDQLNVLAELTGVSVKEQQSALDAALADENYQAYRTHLELDMNKALAAGNTAEAERIKKVIASKDAAVANAKATMGAEGATAMLQALSSDSAVVMTEQTAKLTMSGYKLDKINELTNKGEPAVLEMNRQIATSNKYMYDTYGPLIYKYGDSSKKLQDAFGFEIKTRQTGMKNQDLISDEGFAKAKERERKLTAQQEAKKNAESGEMARRAAQESHERAMRQAFDDLLKQLSEKLNGLVMKAMPLMTKALEWVTNHFDAIVSVTKVLVVALGALVAAAAVGKVFQAFSALSDITKGVFGKAKSSSSGKLGTSSNPVHAIIEGQSSVSGSESKNKTDNKTSNAAALSLKAKAIAGTKVGLDYDSVAERGIIGGAISKAGEHLGNTVGGKLGLGEEASGLVSDAINNKTEQLSDAIGGRITQRSIKNKKGGNTSSLGPITEVAESSGGSKVGTFLEGIVQGLSAAGKPPAPLYITLGSAAIGAAITAIGAGLAGATWIIGKTLPSFAKGLESFDVLDGENLKKVGIGMAGLGVGILALGAGKVAGSISNMVNWFVGGTDPLADAEKQVKKLEGMTIDPAKVKKNSDAMIAFSKAMVAASSLGAVSGFANAAKGMADAVNSYFGGKPPTAQLEDFSKLQIDSKNVKKNALSFKVFAEAMSSYKGYGSNAGAIGSTISDAVSGFFKVPLPFSKLIEFGSLKINAKDVNENASAFKSFAEAMSSYKGYGNNAGSIGSSISDAVSGLLKSNLPYDQLVKFGELVVNTKGVYRNTKAFKSFAEAMSSYKGYGSNTGAIGSTIAQATANFFNVNPPLEQFVSFSHLSINAAKAKNNATAFKYFSEALASYAGMGSPVSAIATSVADAAYKFFDVEPPVDQFVTFSGLNIDPKKTEINAKSFVAFSNAMAEYRGGPGLLDVVSSLIGKGFNTLFGTDGPIEAFRKFSKEDFGPNASENAEAFRKYAEAQGMLAQAGGDSDGAGGSTSSGGSAASSFQSGINAGQKTAGFIGGIVSGGAGLVSNAFDWAAAKITGKPTDVLQFTGQSGKYENFAALDTNMQKAVVLAAQDYKKITGNKMRVNSARRAAEDQERLWAQSVALGTPGRGPSGMLVGKPPSLGGNPPHLRGNAIDLQEGKSDPARAIPILNKYGLNQTYGKKDPVHFDLKARDGGIFTESHTSGKMISSLNADSVLAKIAKIPKNIVSTSKNTTTDIGDTEINYLNNVELTKEIGNKLDELISVLNDNHYVNNKILQHTRN